MPVIALAGNPNTGKTTLFNALTGEKSTTGNWPGVTVQKREGLLTGVNPDVRVIDLPGAYSLTPCCAEEKVTRDYLMRAEYDVIVNVLNPSFLKREMYFTLELFSLNKPIICVLNMADEMKRNGVSLNMQALSAQLGITVLAVSAKTGEGMNTLTEAITGCLRGEYAVSAHPDFSIRNPHEWISKLLPLIDFTSPENSTFAFTEKLDRVLLGKYTAFPFLLIVMAFMFTFAFGAPGQLFTYMIDRAFAVGVSSISFAFDHLPVWADSLIRNGMLTGAFSVLSFLPQVAFLYFFTAFIEESGYMARAAFITDRLLRKIGLSGRSVIPMIMGLGCTTTAVSAARGVDSERDRKMTVMLTPFVSCGAKMPVYALIASECFQKAAPLYMMGVYLIGFLVLSVSGALLNRVLNRHSPSEFLLELPPYRMPEAGEILKRSLLRISEFAKRAGTVIVLTSAVSWFLTYYSPSLTPARTAESSILAHAAKNIAVLFKPMGFASWQAVSALLSGIFAKESILSSLRVFAPDSVNRLFIGHNAFSYLVFILLSPPCASALMNIRRELSSGKLFLLMLAFQLAFACLSAAFINMIA